jgi:hypothetical protein
MEAAEQSWTGFWLLASGFIPILTIIIIIIIVFNSDCYKRISKFICHLISRSKEGDNDEMSAAK